MRPLFLSVDGIFNDECQKYDFTPQTAKLVALQNDNLEELIKYFSLALFGGEQTQGRLELRYEYNNEEYTVRRDFAAGTAELSYKDASLVCRGKDKVDKKIFSQIKMDAKCFEKLAFIDRDKIFAGFMLPSKEREEFFKEFSEELLSGKDDIDTIEKRLEEKYQKTSWQLELIPDVDPKTLAMMKDDIKETKVIRQEAKTEFEELTKSILKGEEALKAQKELEEQKALLEKAFSLEPEIEELEARMQKSAQAQALALLIKRKEEIMQRDIELKEKIAALQSEIQALDANIEKGEKSSQKIEKVLIHCLERIKELRKLVYDNVEKLKADDQLQSKIRKGIDKYFEKDDQEMIGLVQRLEEIDREILATKNSVDDIEQRLFEIKRDPAVKKAIREGAALEAEIKKLSEIIAAAKNSMEMETKRLDVINSQLKAVDEELVQDKQKLESLQEKIKGQDLDEAIKKADDKKKYFYKNHIIVAAQQDEIEKIKQKIVENQEGIKEYEENLEAVNNAQESLKGHMQKLFENKQILQDKIVSVEIKLNYLKQNMELEYGEKCPICDNLVMSKKEEDAQKARELEEKLAKLNQEYQKALEYEQQYAQKLEGLNKRTGELEARIKISGVYIESLKQSILSKTNTIMNIYNESGVSENLELADKMNSAMNEYEALLSLANELKALEDKIKANEQRIAFYENEKKQLEEEVLPNTLQRYTLASESLEQAENRYKSIEANLGGVKAEERLEELALVEKESFTLEEDLSAKRKRLDDLIEEKQGLESLISAIKGRLNKVKIGDEEYDYTNLVMKTSGEYIGEVIEEIRKSEEEAEDIKVEYSAVKKVLEKYKSQRTEKTRELDALNARLSSDEEVLARIMTDYEGSLAALNVENTAELEKLQLKEDEKASIEKQIASYYQNIAVYKNNIERLEETINKYKEELEGLEENRKLYLNLSTKIEELGQKISDVYAHRKEMKSSAQQALALKDKLAKYQEKMDFLKEVKRILEKSGDIPDFIIKLASKKLYSLTKGRNNLDIANGSLVLIDNNNGGKVVERESYKKEDKMLMSFVLGTALNRTIIDMIGGENFMLIFPLKENETSKEIAYALTAYTKKRPLMVTVENAEILDSLTKTL
ncbi:MAG: hypothetical protein QM214_04290 [Bacillota bacterium]|jgi:DNA repair exonuclease SbcCD ATPase subunit|nr:hypothetical protein [Bacillota bacterium]HHU43363.1 hypothetical protein [Clostridiales bacterium]